MAMDCIRIIIQSIKGAKHDHFGASQGTTRSNQRITFQGHRVNDGYSQNKRNEILKVVEDAIDSASPPPTSSNESAIVDDCRIIHS